MKKPYRIVLILIAFLSLCSSIYALAYTDVDGNYAMPDIEYPKYYLVQVAKDTSVYDHNRDKKLFNVKKGDSLLIKRYSKNNKNWALVATGSGDVYIKTSSLVKTKGGKISARTVKHDGSKGVSYQEKSYYIYADKKGEKVIGILRKGAGLPHFGADYNDDGSVLRSKVYCYGGLGYVYDDVPYIDDERTDWDKQFQNLY